MARPDPAAASRAGPPTRGFRDVLLGDPLSREELCDPRLLSDSGERPQVSSFLRVPLQHLI